jgi:NAD(P)-dependent dehydrogenase (short-subunit alcohol dehydrogenase family)
MMLMNVMGVASYAASKGAVVNLTRQIGVDYGKDKIHCNAICPGCKLLGFNPTPFLILREELMIGVNSYYNSYGKTSF